MKARFILIAALAWIGLSAMAQRTERRLDHVEPRTVQEFDHQEVEKKFQSHWFLNLQGGAQYTLTDAKFKNLLSPNVQAAVGYQFTPVFGMRLAANGWQSKGAFDEASANGRALLAEKDYKFNYVGANLDFMFNLSNLFFGWNPERFLNVTAFIGGGANIAWGNDEANDLKSQGYRLENIWDGTKKRSTARGGLQFDFRLSEAVGLLLEGNANVISDYYNSKQSGNADWYFNALAGLRVNLGKSYRTETHDIYRDVVVYDTIYKIVEIIEPQVIQRVEPLRRDVFFLRAKTDIRPEEAAKVQDIAEYLNKYPESKVNIVGYADVQTGNAKINARLAQQRADVVVKALIEDYGISADRITYDSKGDTIQPFAENDLNRVAICVAEE
jgi:outer membrane protein OmpA-like peptidoglycan-associated protein